MNPADQAAPQDHGDLRELDLLEALAREPESRQIDLAARLGMAVGTVNWLVKRMASKGWIKVKRIGRWRWRYILTAEGLSEKARLTQMYLHRSMRMYREVRRESRKLLGELKQRGYDGVVLGDCRESDLLDVCRLTCLEQRVAILGLEEDAEEPRVPVLVIEGRRVAVRWPGEDPESIPELAQGGELHET